MASRRRARAAKKPGRKGPSKARPPARSPRAKPSKKAPRAGTKPKRTAKRGPGSRSTRSTSRRAPAPVAFDEAETQKVSAAEVVEDIEIQLSLDLLPNR
ncbi:MAG: hypothetical protein SFW67_09200 [Myxococcaceae bacterium]|nr:hypothetical protein [Myxococcaceae bacterium]